MAHFTFDKLIKGNARFVADDPDKLARGDRRKPGPEVVNGQDPSVVIVSCADSRVVPELVFDSGIGELFVIRVAGNTANAETIASIEYAVANLNPELIVILGHQNCGAVTAAIAGVDASPHIVTLLNHIKPALEATTPANGAALDPKNADDVATAIHTHARLTAKAIIDESAIIRGAVESGKVVVKSAYYNLTGAVEFHG